MNRHPDKMERLPGAGETAQAAVAGSRCCLGIDLGGTKIMVALADPTRIIAEAVEMTDPRGGRFVFDQIAEMSDRLLAHAHRGRATIGSIVLGMPGAVHPVTGVAAMVPNILGFERLSVADRLGAHLGQAVVVENDVNLAMLGESRHGGARGARNAAFLALGTGVGLGLLVNGELVRGATGAAGEISHLPLGAEIDTEAARRVGSFELEVGSNGIVNAYNATAATPVASVEELFDRLRAGDGPADRVVDRIARKLALAASALQAMLDPELVILGGSIGIRSELVARIERLMPAVFATPVRIIPSALGNRAGLFGALSLGLDRLGADRSGEPMALPNAE